ncbi:MAG: nuclear transport factor 2 family protein [Sphingomonas sp.]|jgi:hypothetical protein|uniref:nuclear transport factor 2 family protein n=1 Tax=Sphingomonas sp. TaxID=28214 RepID=UPI003566E6B8
MTLRFFALLLAWGLIAAPPAAAGLAIQQDETAQAGISKAIGFYFQGHATGDPAHFRKAFLSTAHIEGIRNGVFTSWTVDAYCALFKGTPASDEATRKRTIDVIDVSGNSAMAKATLDHGATIFTDYFVLLKVDGAWRIANKVYFGQPRGARG